MTDRIRTPEPGAVAMVRYSDSDGPWVVGIATTPRGNWRTQEHGSTFSIAEARPLVVIDPDDREQVERLARDLHDRIHKSGSFDVLSRMSQDVHVEFMQAALRSLVTPPKPDEPTGLGLWSRTRTATAGSSRVARSLPRVRSGSHPT